MTSETLNNLSTKQIIKWHILMVPIYMVIVIMFLPTTFGILAEMCGKKMYAIDCYLTYRIVNYRQKVIRWL